MKYRKIKKFYKAHLGEHYKKRSSAKPSKKSLQNYRFWMHISYESYKVRRRDIHKLINIVNRSYHTLSKKGCSVEDIVDIILYIWYWNYEKKNIDTLITEIEDVKDFTFGNKMRPVIIKRLKRTYNI